MTISAEVQAQADKIKELGNIVQSVDAAMAALKTQLTNLSSQVAAVPVAQPVPAGQPAQPGLSQEDKDALTSNISDTQKLIDQLKADIVAGTPQAQPQTEQPAPATASDAAAVASTQPNGTTASPPALQPEPAAPATPADGTTRG